MRLGFAQSPLYHGDAIARPLETMLTCFAIERTVVPCFRRHIGELQDHSALRGRPFQVFVQTIKREFEHLRLMSSDSCLGPLCIPVQLTLIGCLFAYENYVSTHRWCSRLSIRCFKCKCHRGLGV